MDDLSLAHSKYNCTYHIVFIPKYRKKAMFGSLRKEVGEILGKVCKMEEVTIIKAATLPDHVHMYVSIPPKLSVSKTIGRIKGKSALMIFDRHPEYREKYNRHFLARGYYCETVGNVNEETIKKYISDNKAGKRFYQKSSADRTGKSVWQRQMVPSVGLYRTVLL